jgi:hypothetical protein
MSHSFRASPGTKLTRHSLAYAEMRLILARILYNFDMKLAEQSKGWMEQRAWSLWDKPDLWVYLVPRRDV